MNEIFMLSYVKVYDYELSAFFGLKKRSERQFREERVHRLLVPALFLSLTSSFFLATDYFSKLSPNCQQLYEGGNIRNGLIFFLNGKKKIWPKSKKDQ